MTAKEKFRVGQRVQLSVLGSRRIRQYEDMPTQPDVYGTVAGYSSFWPDQVAVIREGRTSRQSYQMDLWDPCPSPEPAGA